MTDSETRPPTSGPNPTVTAEKVAEEVKKLTPFHTRPLLIAGGATTTLILALLLIVIVSRPSPAPVVPSPLPSAASPTTAPAAGPISEIARTEAYQKFEYKLNDLRSANEKIDLSEASLTFPLLDMNVNFKKN